MKKKQSLYIILAVTLLSLAVTLIDAFIAPAYFVKVLFKVIFFLLIPMSYFFFFKSEKEGFKKLFRFQKQTMPKALLFGVAIYAVILGGYFLTRNYFDYSGIVSSIGKMGIDGDNFLYVSIYIALINSFLEEFFFRGFGFITLSAHTGKRFAYIFSSALFAVYHAGMMRGMFELPILILVFVGLFIGGCIFNYLNGSSENIYTSWAAHMFANFAINTVGFIVLGVI